MQSEPIIPPDAANPLHIRAAPCPDCVLCGKKGVPLYSALPDRLFGAAGLTNLRRCPDPRCHAIWPDPRPLADEIWKAYGSYYTHNRTNSRHRIGFLRRTYQNVKRAYLAHKYGYDTGPTSPILRYIGILLYLFPIRRSEIDTEARYLCAKQNGKLLDVGCGSGEWIEQFGKMGWKAQGLDFDRDAVRFATANGLVVALGTLEEQKFPSDTFDAITLNHVIEHVPDPMALLRECLRVLKPGGTMALATPNGNSLGHTLFKQNWRGLEPPRHLQIFTPDAMDRCLQSCGFRNIRVRTYNSKYVWAQSFRLFQSGKPGLISLPVVGVLTLIEQFLTCFFRKRGECVAVLADK